MRGLIRSAHGAAHHRVAARAGYLFDNPLFSAANLRFVDQRPAPTLTAAPFPSLMGVNFGSGAFGSATTASPGVYGTNYWFPSGSDMAYFMSSGRNLKTVRLAMLWERVQQGGLRTALSSNNVTGITASLDGALANGQQIFLDLHNYGLYNNVAWNAGSATTSDFADLWQRLATQFHGHAALCGYDLCNEPVNVGAAWPSYAQAAINAIRTVDPTTWIIVEGKNWAQIADWTNNQFTVTDPASRIVYSGHLYFDGNHSGNYVNPYPDGSTTTSPTGWMTPFLSFITAQGTPGIVGECGWPPDVNWEAEGDNFLAFCKAHGIFFTYWAGDTSGGYTINPEGGAQKPQVAQMITNNIIYR